MTYALTGLLAIVLLIITNQDILFKKQNNYKIPAIKEYHMFLHGVLAFYIVDAMWGVFDYFNLNVLLYIDTVLYFALMSFGVFLWSRYVIKYLERKSIFSKALLISGYAYMVLLVIVIILNAIFPDKNILFSFDENGVYHPHYARYAIFFFQVTLYFLTSIYSFVVSIVTKTVIIRRYRTIAIFGLAMIIVVLAQMAYPLEPLYTMGYMIGIALLYTFLIEEEKEQYRKEIVQSLDRERKHQKDLYSARELAYTDPLTGVKSKLAYIEYEALLEQRIANN